jgi:hypothetical protein
MTPTPASAKPVDLKNILPIIAKDFEAIRISFASLVKLRKEERFIRSSTAARQRQDAYKERFKPIISKKTNFKEGLKETSNDLFGALRAIGGVLGSMFAILGVAGIAKIVGGTDAGKFLKDFVVNVLNSVVDVIQKAFTTIKGIFQNADVQQSFFKTVKSIFDFIGTSLISGFQIVKNLLTDGEVISKFVEVIKSVFSAIFASVGSLVSIVGTIFTENTESIKNGLVEFFTKIINVIIPILSIAGGAFRDLLTDERFKEAFGNIVKNFFGVIIAAFKVSYKDGDKQKSVAGELLMWAGGIAAATVAFTLLKIKMFQLGAALEASNFSKDGPCDCGPIGPDDLPDADKKKGGRYKSAGRQLPAKEQTVLEKLGEKYEKGKKYLTDKARAIANSVKEGFEKIKGNAKKLAEMVKKPVLAMIKNPKLQSKIGAAALKRFGENIVARIIAKAATLPAGLTGFGLVLALANTALIAYDLYQLWHFLFVSSDGEKEDGGFVKVAGIEAEIDKWYEEYMKGEKSPTQAEVPVVTPAATPTPAPAATASTTKPSMASTAATPPSTTPSPQTGAEVVARQREMAGSDEGGVPERTISGYSYAATEALKSKMKVGDVSAKQHEPGTDVLAQNLMGMVPGFNRFTAFDDAFHNKVSPGSKHASGLALDFTVNGGSEAYKKAAASVRTHLSSLGLGPADVKVIDEMNNPSSKATGPHIHVQFQSAEAAERYRSQFPNTALSSFAKGAKDFLLDVEQGAGRGMSAAAKALENVLPSLDSVKKVGGDVLEMAVGGLISGLKFVDGMTGGKLGLGSNEMNTAMRMLEDEAKKGGGLFDLSSTIVSNKVENKTIAPVNPKSQDSATLNMVLSRHYT